MDAHFQLAGMTPGKIRCPCVFRLGHRSFAAAQDDSKSEDGAVRVSPSFTYHSYLAPNLPPPPLFATIVLERERILLFEFLWSPHPDPEINLPLASPRSAANFGDSARTV